MRIICRGNCTGKTKELIKESLESNIPILALTFGKEQSLKEKSYAYFNETVRIVNSVDAETYEGDVLVDDLDKLLTLLLQKAFNNNKLFVKGISLSNDN